MRLDESLTYPFGPRRAAEMLADQAFHEEVCRRSGSDRYAVQAEEESPGGAFTVTISREMTTESLPEFARGFVGPRVTVSQRETWSAADADGGRRGTVTLSLSGVPLHVDATQELRTSGDAGADGGGRGGDGGGVTVHSLAGELISTMPFMGAKIEQAAAPILREALAEQQDLAAEWPAR